MKEPITHSATDTASSLCGPEQKPDTVNNVLEHSRLERFAIAQALARRLRATTAYPPVNAAVQRVAASGGASGTADDSLSQPQKEPGLDAEREPSAWGVTAQAGFWD